jgi:hypothetical protein
VIVLVDDELGRLTLRRVSRLDRIAAWRHGTRLDRELAAGAEPESRPDLAARAMRLTSRRFRHGLAAGLRRAADPPRTGMLKLAVPVRAGQADRAAGEMLQLAARLDSDAPLGARGIARLTGLLSDGASPLYREAAPDVLREELGKIGGQFRDVS